MLRCALIVTSVIALSAGEATAADRPPVAESCGVLVEEGGVSRVERVPDFEVLEASLPLQRPGGYERIVGVLCDRADFVIADNDQRVITDLSVPLYLSFGDATIVMEISNGQLRMRTIQGQLSEVQTQAVQIALNRNQSVLQGDPP